MPTSPDPVERPRTDAAPPAGAVPNNLPLALSSFVGREREVGALVAALEGTRLVTVTGPGGAGKTRVVREVAVRLSVAARDVFPDGVWWLELAPVADATQVPQAVAAAIGVRPTPGRDVTDAVAEALHAHRALLVLDNCEHVIEAAAAFTERLLRAAPTVAVLATSREALAVEGEAVWVLPPLGTPPATRRGAGGGAEALLDYDAVRLFVERAQAASPTFALDDANAGAVAAITARLDGLPLALELAAAAIPGLGVEQLAARLDDVFALLTRGRRTALPPPPHAAGAARLELRPARPGRARAARPTRDVPGSVHARRSRGGGWRRFACRWGIGCGAAARRRGGRARPAGGALARDVREQGGETRYRLLETVRQYGLARLASRPTRSGLRGRATRRGSTGTRRPPSRSCGAPHAGVRSAASSETSTRSALRSTGRPARAATR
jgi:predicted ATPase